MNIFEEFKVFQYFGEISKIPRASGAEKELSDYIADWARGLGLDVLQDSKYNLIIKKPATPGYEDCDALIVQAHLDMVCEKTSGSTHDFSKDPLCLEINGDWLSARETTLGADNGIGVAIAMALLDDEEISHPALEVVLTACEETDFSGAACVEMDALSATRMINLDHACETELIIGSCGGLGVEFALPISRETEMPEGFKPYKLCISGLKGGHSGEDIHRGRAHAIALLFRIVEKSGLPLISIDGGTSRLAIPRDAAAVVLSDDEDCLKALVEQEQEALRKEYANESSLALSAQLESENSYAGCPIDDDSMQKLRDVMEAYPNGIVSMFEDLPGVVESSDNIGIIETGCQSIRLVSEIRGGYSSSIASILDSIISASERTGAVVNTFAAYEPWSANPGSELQELAMRTYESVNGTAMTPIAVHAGLECGFFASAKPGIDIISLGPNCENYHSPQERLSVSSTIREYNFIVELLSNMK